MFKMIKKTKILSMFVVFAFFMQQITNIYSDFSTMLGWPTLLPIFYIFIYLSLLASILISTAINPTRMLAFFLLFIMLIISSCLFGNFAIIFNFGQYSYSDIVGSNFFLFAFNYFLFVCILFCGSFDELLKHAKPYAYISTVLFIALVIFSIFGHYSFTFSYMTIAYSSLPGIYCLMFYSTQKKRIITWLLLCLSIVLSLVGGSRGAILCLLLVLVFWMLFRKRISFGRLAYLLVFFSLAIIVIANFDSVTRTLYTFLSNTNYQSRLITMSIDETGYLFHSSDRISIYQATISNTSIFGNGIFSSRILASLIDTTYPHNIVLEIWYDFGFIVGTVFVLLLIASAFKCLFYSIKAKKKEFLLFSIVLFSFFFCKMMVSASYLIDSTFGVYFGLSILIIIEGKKHETIIKTNPHLLQNNLLS